MEIRTNSWIEELYDIFQCVQEAEVFADQKFFADCVPRHSLDQIRKAFESCPEGQTDLYDFVKSNFDFPKSNDIKAPGSKDVLGYIDSLWPRLVVKHQEDHGTLIGLPEELSLIHI